MTRLKNTSNTLFRYQEYYWRPDETIVFNENGYNSWEDVLARDLSATYKNLVVVTDEKPKRTPEELAQFRRDTLQKAREARKAKNEESN